MKRIIFLWSLLTVLLVSCNKNGIVIDINQVAFPADKKIIFGGNQDVMITGMPDSVLSVRYSQANNKFYWELIKPVYCKLNKININFLPLDSVKLISVGNLRISTEDVNELIKDFSDDNDGVSYVALRYLLLKKHRNAPEMLGKIHFDSIKTIIHCNDGDVSPGIIFLDTLTYVTGNNGKKSRLKHRGEILGDELNVAFYRNINSFLLRPDAEDNVFHIKDSTFYSVVKPRHTPFGASEINVRFNQNLKVSFNRHYRDLIPMQALDSVESNFKIGQKMVRLVPVKQKQHANTFSSAVYIQNISNSDRSEIGIFDSAGFGINKNNIYMSGSNVHVFHADRTLFILGILPLTLLFIFLLIMVYRRIDRDDFYESSGSNNITKWKRYSVGILTLLYILSIGRHVVAYNLAYTAPFFTFTHPTTIIVSPLVLLAVFYLWIVFWCIGNGTVKFPIYYRWIFGVIIPVTLFFLLYFTICKLFPFYLQELSQYTTFKGFVQLFNRDTPVHFLTIISLSVFILILSLYLLVKNKFYKLPAAGNRFSPTSANLSLTFLNRIITLRWLNWLYLIFPPFSFFLFLIGMLFLVLGTTSYSVWLLLLIVLLLLWQKRSWLQADNNEIYKLMEKLRNSNLAKWFMLISQNNKIRDQINKILLKKIAKGNLTEHVEMKRAFKNSFGDLFLNTLIMSLAIIVSVLFYNDAGYLINIWLFVLLLLLVLYYRRELNAFDGENINIKYKKYYTPFLAISGGSAVLLFYLIIVLTTYNFEPLGSGRFSGRVVSFFDYNKMQEIGLRESEKQSQFFAELGKYTYPSAYNTYEPVHSGISSFLDPIVKNDLSVPFGFIYQFQEWWWLAVFLLLFTWLSLIYLVVYSIVSIDNGSNMVFPRFALVRLFSVSVIAGSGFYLLCSYYNILPFTGRLIYGMGQDSIAEVYETIFLFAILGFIAPVQHNIKKNADVVTT